MGESHALLRLISFRPQNMKLMAVEEEVMKEEAVEEEEWQDLTQTLCPS